MNILLVITAKLKYNTDIKADIFSHNIRQTRGLLIVSLNYSNKKITEFFTEQHSIQTLTISS